MNKTGLQPFSKPAEHDVGFFVRPIKVLVNQPWWPSGQILCDIKPSLSEHNQTYYSDHLSCYSV